MSALYPQGSGLTNEAVHDFNTLSNIDGYDSVRLYEAWLQREFADGRFSIRLGQILADAEFFVSDYGALFINSSLGAIPLLSQNLNPPIFPTAAPGVRLRADPSETFYAEVAFFSGDVGASDTTNKHNTRLSPFAARMACSCLPRSVTDSCPEEKAGTPGDRASTAFPAPTNWVATLRREHSPTIATVLRTGAISRST